MFETKKITVGELGPRLPIGVAGPNGILVNVIAVRPWRMKEEKILARALKDQPRTSSVKVIPFVLSTMCRQLGAMNFETDESLSGEGADLARRVSIGDMLVPDVFYAYVWLRIQSLGSEIDIPCKCAQCAAEFSYTADLNTLDVVVPVDPNKIEWEYALRTPIQISGKTVTGFRLSQQTWRSTDVAASNMESAKASVIMASVRGFIGEEAPAHLLPSDLDELTKYDLEKISSLISENTLGAKFYLEVQCPTCSAKWDAGYGWTYNDFFGVSSDSSLKKI